MAQLCHNFNKTVRKLLKISGRACKPDFVPLATRKANCTRGDHSSRSRLAPQLKQPTRGLLSATTQLLAPPRRKRSPLSRITLGEPGRLSPPIWPCTTRGFPCLRCCHRSGGLLPHLFTLTNETSCSKTSRRFTCKMPPCCSAGGLFSVALSVNRSHNARRTSHHANRSPGVTWRVALYPERARSAPKGYPSPALASLRRRCPDFPPAQPSYDDQASDHPAHPLPVLYRRSWSTPCHDLRYFAARSFSNSLSVSTGTPSSFALSYFEPGSVPTTT
jgi:hypothetical protein